MKSLLCGSAAALALVVGSPASAQESQHQFSANATLASNYIFRGTSLSDDKPALQLGGDYEHSSGFYAGVWGSNYDLAGKTEIEIDWWGGYYAQINDNLGIDLSATRYYYYDVGGHTTEYKIGADLYDGSVAAHYDQHLETWYFEAAYGFGLTEQLSLTPSAGLLTFRESGNSSEYNLGLVLDYSINDYFNAFAGAAYQEVTKSAYVVGVTVAF